MRSSRPDNQLRQFAINASTGADPSTEDDCVLLTVALDASRDTSYLLLLDARDLTELGRASVSPTHAIQFPRRVPSRRQHRLVKAVGMPGLRRLGAC
jgi:carotenoid cleavage dioxygenase-like enzyme